MAGSVTLRVATPADEPVLRSWDEQPHVIASGGLDDELDWSVELARDVDWQEILVAELDGEPIGVIQSIDPRREESHYWGEIEAGYRALDIWIGPAEMLGRGYGTAMMSLALDRCFADPAVRAVLIDPLVRNEDAIRFYRRIGFVEVEDRWFGDDECLVMEMDRDRWEQERA